MAESTLTLLWADHMNFVAEYLQYGRESDPGTPTVWSTDQTGDVTRTVARGYRKLLYPPNHVWSWIHPRATIVAWATVTGTISGAPSKDNGTSTITATASKFYASMVGKTFTFDTSGTDYTISSYTSATVIKVTGDASGETSGDTFTITADGSYRFPDDFGGIIGGRFYFDAGEGRYIPLDLYGEGQVTHDHQITDTTGRPRVAAQRPLSSDSSSGQRWDLIVAPIPDANYPLHYRFVVLPDAITSTNNYPLGGLPYSEALRLACLSEAEMDRDGQQGPHALAYERALATAIAFDRRTKGAKRMGICRDPSFLWDSQTVPQIVRDKKTVTYNGTVWGD